MDDESPVRWLRDFGTRMGRPLRVLHVGNIANNAYLNAKFLRSAGVDAHVLCYDYYHIMAMPEWEDVELLAGHGDDFFPQFSPTDLGDYQRPSWFVNSPLIESGAIIAGLWGEKTPWLHEAKVSLQGKLLLFTTRYAGRRAGHALQLLLIDWRLFFERLRRFVAWRVFGRPAAVPKLEATKDNEDVRRLIAAYDDVFPNRTDRLTASDIFPYLVLGKFFRDIFSRYDIVQCYSTDPIHALVSAKHPYVSFEHGTLRHFTTDDVPLHRMTALAYRQADHVFITNGDCLAYADRLGVKDFSPIIHPIDVEQHRQDFGDAIAELRREAGADVLLFCPTRHDWDIKGTDRFIRALPLIKSQVPGVVRMILMDWGLQVDGAKALLQDLGCDADVIWKKPMCRIAMIKHIRAADVVFDQMVLPVFGSTAPQSIAAGAPVVGSYVPEETRWLIAEPAPILSAFTPEEVSQAVVTALDPDWLADYKRRARTWTDTYHHSDVLVREHLRVYRDVMAKYETTPGASGSKPTTAARPQPTP